MSDFKPWTPIYTKLPGMDAEARKNAICRDSASLNQSALRAPTSCMIGVSTCLICPNTYGNDIRIQGRRRVSKSGPAEKAIECRRHERGESKIFECFYVRF